jgi:hypothetical protein
MMEEIENAVSGENEEWFNKLKDECLNEDEEDLDMECIERHMEDIPD